MSYKIGQIIIVSFVLIITAAFPALAATKLPPGRVPESRPLQPAPENEFPEYLETITPAPSETGSDNIAPEKTSSPGEELENSNQSPQNPTRKSSSLPGSSRTIFWILLVVTLIVGGAIATFQVEKKK